MNQTPTALPRPARSPSRRGPRLAFTLRPVSLAACLIGAVPAAFGLPQGAVPTFGQATVRQTAPGQLDIQQTTQKAGLDWTSFSIAAGERVNVVQPGRSSVLLNRVLGDNPSLIYGNLSSNGGVWLINPRGIVFGANSRVDVGSLVASTLSIKQEDLMSGRLQLGRGAGEAGELRAEGSITATDGTVALVAPRVTVTSSGRIDARRVAVVAAGEVQLDLEGDGMVVFNARSDGLDARLEQLGKLTAGGSAAGSIELRAAARAGLADTVLNLEGVVQARSLGVREGRIVVDGGDTGITRVAGTLDASGRGAGERGGDVLVLGQRVLLDTTAVIDASGAGGGGRVRVGGDFSGANPDIRNAEMLVVRPGADIRADATIAGNGGQVVMWSDDSTRFYGHVSARGGAAGGDGGQAEVSGKRNLEFRGSADLGATQGAPGSLLLDPDIIIISNIAGSPATGDIAFGGAGTTTILASGANSLSTLLGTTSVSLSANNTVTVTNAVSASGVAPGALTLRAGGNINVNADITAVGITLAANAPGGTAGLNGRVLFAAGVNLDAGTGALTISNAGSTLKHLIAGDLGLSGASMDFSGDAFLGANSIWTVGGTASTYSGVLSSGFNLTKAGSGTLTLTGNNIYSGGTTLISNGTLALSGSGAAVVGTIAVGANRLNINSGASVANAITIGSGGTIGNTAGIGTLAAGSTITFSAGNISLASASGGELVVNRVLDDGGNTRQITATGGGIVTLAGANSYDGGTNVAANTTLRLTNDSGAGSATIALGANTLDIASGANVTNTVTASGSATITSSTGNGTLGGGTLTIADGTTLNLGSGGGSTLTIGRAIPGVGGGAPETVTVTGGTVVLAANNSYSGGTAVSAGTLRISGAGSDAGSGTIAVGANTLDIASGASVGNVVTIGAGGTITSSAGTGTLATNATPLSLTNGGTLNLSGTDLQVSRLISGGNGASNVNIASGTVTFTTDNTYTGTSSIAGGATAVLGTGGGSGSLGSGNITNLNTLSVDHNNTLTFGQIISGSGVMTVAGGGTTVLTGANTFSGGVTVTGGSTLRVSGATAKAGNGAEIGRASCRERV